MLLQPNIQLTLGPYGNLSLSFVIQRKLISSLVDLLGLSRWDGDGDNEHQYDLYHLHS